MRSPLVTVSLLSIGLGAILGILQLAGLLGVYGHFSWASFLFFALSTPIIIWIGLRSNKAATEMGSANMMLGATMLQFVSSMAFVVIYALIVRPNSLWFVLPFFAFYILYSGLSTYLLMQMKWEGKREK